MKRIPLFLLGCVFSTSCQTNSPSDSVVSQTFVHKYGFETSEEEWEAREQDGQVVSLLKSGVKVSRSYENGYLHGPTTYTFPHSSIVERVLVYDQGTLLKEQRNDEQGMPIREDVYEFDNKKVATLWNDKGVPLSIEHYQGSLLLEGKYYTPDHELEAVVSGGSGERVKRERSGLLVSRDEIEEGVVTCCTNYHPNGAVHTISRYENGELHGPQIKFTASGKPLMELNWERGVLDGPKVVYRNGLKVAVIPYIKGEKQGIEYHYDDLGNLTAEIEWKNDKKHGTTQLYSEEGTEVEWFFKGQAVSADKFKILENREQVALELRNFVPFELRSGEQR